LNVALVYPRYRTTLAVGLEEPLGILTIASVLREAGHQARVFDLTFAQSLDCLDGALSDAHWIGVSATSSLFGKAIDVLNHVRQVAPDVPAVVGGPHATIDPEDALRAGFDYAFLGEAENTVLPFTELLAKGSERECPGIAWMEDGAVHENPRAEFVHDLDAIPFAARDDVAYQHYPTIGMVASRGCPFHCLYCQPTVDRLFGNRVRHRSPANVAAEMEQALAVAGDKDVYFKDDTLTLLQDDWFAELGTELEGRGISPRWQANSRVDTVTREKLKTMRDAGCAQVGFGVESGSPEVLKFYRKATEPAQAERAFRWCHELGILPHAFLMLGAPDETLDDLEMTFDLVKRIKPGSWSMYTTTPLPGTGLYSYASEHGLLDITGYEDFDNAESLLKDRPVMKLRHITQDDITRYRSKIDHYLIRSNLLNPRVILKALRRPGAAIRKLRKAL
jgi:anaerobic magnesium-protoporphyrin IX monomethyl ester cyclase